jgi:hypothetical protein
MSKLLETFSGWVLDVDILEAHCGVVTLEVDAEDPIDISVRWRVSYVDDDYGGWESTVAEAKSKAIAAAEKLLEESAALLAELKRQASAPCANCGGLARRDGRCVGCGKAIAT